MPWATRPARATRTAARWITGTTPKIRSSRCRILTAASPCTSTMPTATRSTKNTPTTRLPGTATLSADQIIELDEYDLGGKKLYKTTCSWDAEGNRLSEMQYNHGQSGSAAAGPDALAEDPATDDATVAPDTQEQEAPRCGIISLTSSA